MHSSIMIPTFLRTCSHLSGLVCFCSSQNPGAGPSHSVNAFLPWPCLFLAACPQPTPCQSSTPRPSRPSVPPAARLALSSSRQPWSSVYGRRAQTGGGAAQWWGGEGGEPETRRADYGEFLKYCYGFIHFLFTGDYINVR